MTTAAAASGVPALPDSLGWAQDQLRTLYLWDTSEKQNILRAAVARGFNLDPVMFARPFPGSPPAQMTIVSSPDSAAAVTQPSPAAATPTPAAPAAAAPSSFFSTVLPWILTAALGTGGLGAAAGYIVPKLLTTPMAATTPAAVQPATPAPTAPAQKAQEWEIKYKLGPNGQWQTQVAPVPVSP